MERKRWPVGDGEVERKFSLRFGALLFADCLVETSSLQAGFALVHWVWAGCREWPDFVK